MSDLLSILSIGVPLDLIEHINRQLGSEHVNMASEQLAIIDDVLQAVQENAPDLVIIDDSTLTFSVLDLQLVLQQHRVEVPLLALVHNPDAVSYHRLLTAGIHDVLDVDQLDRLAFTVNRIMRDYVAQRDRNRFRQLFADNPLPMYIYDHATLRFLEVNEAAVIKYGYHRDEFLTMTLKDIRPPEELDRLMGAFTHQRPSLNLYDKSWTHRLKDGTLIEVDIADHDTNFAGKSAGLVVAIDVTERNRAVAALRESEHQFKALIEYAPEAVFITDKHGKYMHVNQRACDLLGYTREEFLTRHTTDILLVEDAPSSHTRIDDLLRGRTIISERRLVHKDGPILDTIVSARALDENRLLAMVQDISDLKRTEEALIASEQRFLAIIESQTEMVIRWLLDGRLSFANDAYYNFLGLTRTDAADLNIFDYLHPDDSASVIDQCNALTYAQPVAVHEHRITRIDGETRWTQWSNRAIFNLDGNVVEIQSVGNDITARKQAEERIAFLFHLLDVTNAASDVESALNATLQLLCEHHQWVYGEVWLPTDDGSVLLPGSAYYIQPAYRQVLSPLRHITETTTFPKGVGQLGHMLEVKEMSWIDDLTQASLQNFPRKPLLEAAGLLTSIIVPIVVADEVIAVVHFATTGHVKRNERQEMLLKAAVNQLGTVILRKRANDQLRSDEQKYRSLLQSFDSLILMIDGDGHILFANEVGWQRFDLPPDQRADKTLMDVLPADDAKQLMDYAQRVMHSHKGMTEERFTTIGGKVVWLQISYQPVHNGSVEVKYVLINASDISQLKYAESSLARAAVRLQILHSIDSAILRAQSAQEIAEIALDHLQRLIPYHRAAVAMINTETMIGNYLASHGHELKNADWHHGNLSNFVATEAIPKQRFILMNSAEVARQWGADYESLFHNGAHTLMLITMEVNETRTALMTMHSTNANAFTGEHIEIALEITDQLSIAFKQNLLLEQIQDYAGVLEDRVEQRTAEVAQAKTRIETILNTSSDGILVVDSDHIIQQLNPAVDTLFETMPDAYVGHSLVSLVQASDRALINEAMTIASRDETIQVIEVRAVRQDNSVFDAEIGIASTKRLNGDRPTYVCSVRNITTRKRTEELLRQALQQEKELSELKTRFISMASHEFRTPLATIRAATETLGAYRAKMTDEQMDARLRKIQYQVAHLTDIMDEVLTVARIQAKRLPFSPLATDLDEFCREIVEEFTAHPDLNHTINYHCATQNTEVALDRMLMRQIVSNLLGNAIKYSPKNTSIDLTLSCTNTDFVLRIQDHGIGIPLADQMHLFEAFHRASNVGTIPGTGLGLTIVKQAVELHGGTLTFESQLSIGTVFIVTIPLALPTLEDKDDNHIAHRR